MLYLIKVPDRVRFLESQLKEVFDKVDEIDAVVGRVDGMPVKEFMARVETLEANATRLGSFKRGNNLMSSTNPIEEHVTALDSSQKAIIQTVNELLEDTRTVVDVIKTEITNVSARVNITNKSGGKPSPSWGKNLVQLGITA